MYSGRKNIEPNSWFWSPINTENYKNQYVYFKKDINISNDIYNAKICISVDTNFALWINDTFVDCGQYLSYPHIKFYDEINIKSYLTTGNNTILILAYYQGLDSASYVAGKPGMYASITVNDLCYSGVNGWSYSSDTGYVNGDMYLITSQIGYGFKFNAVLADNPKWRSVKICENDATLPKTIYERPVKKLIFNSGVINKTNSSGRHFLIDLKKEISGFFTFSLKSEKNTKIKITYEEYADTENEIIPEDPDNRNFCFYYTTGGGQEEFTHYLKKIACRYLQIEADRDINLDYAGVIPTVYPVNFKNNSQPESAHGKIYDICIQTLLNCMHEKYEDTPWREQALYAQDARNQARFGYCVFENNEFPLACLKLLAESITEDGFVRLTSPSAFNRYIPYFSYMWVLMFTDYYRYTGDVVETEKLLPYVEKLINIHIDRYGKNGIISMPEKEGIWSFYEWADGLDGAYYDENNIWHILPYNKERSDAIINLFFLMALKEIILLLEKLGRDISKYKAYSEKLTENINTMFYNKETQLYCSYRIKDEQYHYCELTQALAILTGACVDEAKPNILKLLSGDNTLVKTTLSCMIYKFEAILLADENMKEYVLDEIERIFSPMLDESAPGCCWETEKGKADFKGCGSMCHGWSVFPIYFYNKLFR